MQATETYHPEATADVQAFGALATRLGEALGQARAALAHHGGVLPEGTLAAIDALRAEFERRRVRIAVYGEVKAGKSTLANALVGADLSPVGFDPLTSVPVRMTYGAETSWRVGDRPLASVRDLEQAMRDGLNGTREVVIETPLDLLQLGGQVDLLDTPGVGSAEQFDAVSAGVLRSLDAVVLVVRYPALFTQFTRRLMDGLQTDIAKLFVVWNLDADCAELTPQERQRHAEVLRANVAGAHELFLIDARAALRAMQNDDAGGTVSSGVSAFIAALTRFVSSSGRDVVALREAAKRAHAQLGEGHGSLAARQAGIEQALTEARARLQAVQAAADAAVAATRERFAEVEQTLRRAGEQWAAAGTKCGADLDGALRRARRRWARRGHIGALEGAAASAASDYADRVHAASAACAAALDAAATAFGTTVATSVRERTEPTVAELAPQERQRRATKGRWQWLRRAVWRRWYLPGLAELMRTGIASDRAAQQAWSAAAAAAVHAACSATLAARLAEIGAQAETETEQIKKETDYAAQVAELERLTQDVPVIAAQHSATAGIVSAARHLM